MYTEKQESMKHCETPSVAKVSIKVVHQVESIGYAFRKAPWHQSLWIFWCPKNVTKVLRTPASSILNWACEVDKYAFIFHPQSCQGVQTILHLLRSLPIKTEIWYLKITEMILPRSHNWVLSERRRSEWLPPVMQELIYPIRLWCRRKPRACAAEAH